MNKKLYEADDAIWSDDYSYEDSDIELSDLADSPDDMEDGFFDLDDEDDVDIEDESYWDDAEEYDPEDYEFSTDEDVMANHLQNWQDVIEKNYDPDETEEERNSAFLGAAQGAMNDFIDKEKNQPVRPSSRKIMPEKESKLAFKGVRVKESAEKAYHDWISNSASNYDVSCEDAFEAGYRAARQKTLSESLKYRQASSLREDTSAFISSPRRLANDEIPSWVFKAFHESKGDSAKFVKLCKAYKK